MLRRCGVAGGSGAGSWRAGTRRRRLRPPRRDGYFAEAFAAAGFGVGTVGIMMCAYFVPKGGFRSSYLVYAHPPMSERRIEAFFYGLYMDLEVLREVGVAPLAPRKAYVDGFALRIGRRATLLPSTGARTYGMLYMVTHADLERLYTAPGLEHYRPEAVMAQPLEGAPTPALCYNLREAPAPHERNTEYATRLQRALSSLAFPPEYVASIS